MGRPKIKVLETTGMKLLRWTAYLVVLTTILVSVVYYRLLPDKIPAHFNLAGEIDRYGDRLSVFLLPLISVIMVGFIDFIGKRPEWHNYPVEITPTNARRLYSGSTTMLMVVNLICALLFLVIELIVIDSAIRSEVSPFFWLIWVLVAILLLLAIISIISTLHKKQV